MLTVYPPPQALPNHPHSIGTIQNHTTSSHSLNYYSREFVKQFFGVYQASLEDIVVIFHMVRSWGEGGGGGLYPSCSSGGEHSCQHPNPPRIFLVPGYSGMGRRLGRGISHTHTHPISPHKPCPTQEVYHPPI